MTATELHARLVVAWAEHKTRVSQVQVTAAAWELYDEVSGIFARAREEGPDPVEVGSPAHDLRGTLVEVKVNPCDSLHVRFILALRSFVGDVVAYHPEKLSQGAQLGRLLVAVVRLTGLVALSAALVALAVVVFRVSLAALVGALLGLFSGG